MSNTTCTTLELSSLVLGYLRRGNLLAIARIFLGYQSFAGTVEPHPQPLPSGGEGRNTPPSPLEERGVGGVRFLPAIARIFLFNKI